MMATAFKKRNDFPSDDEYAEYVRNNVKEGHTVTCRETFEEITAGDSGTVLMLKSSHLHDLNVLVDWHHKCSKYWLKYVHVEIVGPLDPLKVGDWVRVKSAVIRPKFEWGKINRVSIGVVTALNSEADTVIIDYLEQHLWKCQFSEAEKVLQNHPGVMCSSCQTVPIKVSRFKCTECSDFNLCQDCFVHKNDHQHDFNRIICPGGQAVLAGKPDDVLVIGDSVCFKPELAEPSYGWGKANCSSFGVLTGISPNGKDITVDFPEQSSWQGLLPEICKHTQRKNTRTHQSQATEALAGFEIKQGVLAMQRAVAAMVAATSSS